MIKKKFNVEGMTCAACQAHVQKAVERLDGVQKVNVNLLQNTMDVEYDETNISDNLIEKSVSDAGYKAYLPDTKEKISSEKDHSLRDLIVSALFLVAIMYFSMGNMMWGFPSPKFLDHHHNPMGFALIQFL